MGYPTKVQHIERQRGTDQWYINFPTPIAEAMGFVKGEIVEWTLVDKSSLILCRQQTPPNPVDIKKKIRR
jgi:hypothetical protein